MSALTNATRSIENITLRAARMRASGRWPAWNWRAVHGVPGGAGWTRDIRRVAENGIWAVLVREVETPWGPVLHAAISMVAPPAPTWPEKQRIKDTLFGRDRTAVEVFPPHAEIIDAADMYHLWVLPPGLTLPFTIADRARAAAGVPALETQETHHGPILPL